MEFGKLPNIDRVDFSLPPEPEPNADVLSGLAARVQAPHIYVGATGYNMKPWVGSWYPAGCKEREFLRYYGQQFNTIEHNTTHYRTPDLATLSRWKEEVPADFRYCPKVLQALSHSGDLGISNPLFDLFTGAMQEFGEHMGYCFLQLPPWFEPKHLLLLERFLRRWPTSVPLAVEVRHELFFQPTVAAESFFQLLYEHRAATVITDVAGRRDVCHMRLTAGAVLIRFVGNALHQTDYQRINEWADRLHLWFEQGLHSAYIFTHEPDNMLAPDLAAYTVQTCSTRMPMALIRGPRKILPPAQQGTLF